MAERVVAVTLRANIADFSRQISQGARSLDDLAKKSGQAAGVAQTSLGRMAQSAQLQKDAWQDAGRALTVFGAATVGALGASIKAAIDWESQWAGVTKTVDGSEQQLAALEGQLRSMARTMPATHQEIAAVAEAAGALGVATKDVAGFTRTMIMLGETTNLTADEAATMTAQISNVMGTLEREGAKGVERFAATLVQLGNNGASTEAEILAMAQRISATASVIGMSEADVLSYANALSSVGINAEAGGTAISRVFMSIATSAAQGGDDLQQFAQIAGMSAQEFARAFEEDPARAVAAFIQGLGGIQDAGGNVFATLEQLGLSDIRVSQALLTMAESGDLLTDSLNMGEEAWKNGTAAQDEYAKRLATTQAQLDIAKNNVKDAAISFGSVFLPAVSGASGVLSDFAGAIAGLPPEVLGLVGSLSGIVGVTALAAGGFAMLFPRVIDTVAAFKQLSSTHAGVTTGLTRAGKAAGIAAAAFATLSIANAVVDGLVGNAASLDKTTAAMLDLGNSAQKLDSIFAGMSDNIGPQIDGMTAAFERLAAPTLMDRLSDVAGEILSFGGNEGSAERDALIQQMNMLGQSLASLVESGDAEKAAEQYDVLADAWLASGGTLAELDALLPAYTDALAGADNAQKLAGESATGAAGGMAGMGDAASGAVGGITQLTAAQEELIKVMSGADADFIDFQGALEGLIQAQQGAAGSSEQAAGSIGDSWEEMSKRGKVSIDAWLDDLERQVEAQQNWETNMLILSSRVSEDVLTELARLGPEGAPLVADLVDASDAELKRLETVAGQRTEAATTNIADTLAKAGPYLTMIGASLGEDTMNAVAEQLAAGEVTLDQVIAKYDLNKVKVDADTSAAIDKINGLVISADSSTGIVKIDGESQPGDMKLSAFLHKIGTSAEDVTIDGNPIPANMTLSEFMWKVYTSKGAVTIGGDNKQGRAALGALVSQVNGSKGTVKVYADTAQARNQVAALRDWADSQNASITVTVNEQQGVTVQRGRYAGRMTERAEGGFITGPGGPTDDRIPALLSNGEYVLRADAVRHYGLGTLDAMNARRLAEGGFVGKIAKMANGGKAQANTFLNLAASFNVDFADLNSAFDSVVERNRRLAEEAAKASKSTKDSWKDFASDFPLRTKDVVAAFEAQIRTQRIWETNMRKLSGRVSDEFLTALGEMGASGAKLVGQLSRSTDAQLRNIDALWKRSQALQANAQALQATAQAEQEATEAAQQFASAVAAISQQSMSLGGFAGAYQSAADSAEAMMRAQVDSENARRRSAAESRAASTLNANDSWEDYYTPQAYRAVQTSADMVLAVLQDQRQALLDWRQDLIELSGRTSSEFLEYVASELSPEWVALLADSTDEQLAEFEDIWKEMGQQSGERFAETLLEAGPTIKQIGRKFGSDVVSQVAQQLASGKKTLQQVVNQWDLKATVQVSYKMPAAPKSGKGFADGGYTGNMPTSAVAGVVHGREYVWDAQTTARYLPVLDAARRGMMPAGVSTGPVVLAEESVQAVARAMLAGAGAVGRATARESTVIARKSGGR